MSVEQDMGMLVGALDGLNVRFDYYEITISDAIASISTQDSGRRLAGWRAKLAAVDSY